MSILWFGGEEIDFPTRIAGVENDTGGTHRRTTYSRAAVSNPGGAAGNIAFASTPLASPITSGWFSCQYFPTLVTEQNIRHVGVGRSTTIGGLAIGIGSATAKAAVFSVNSSGTATKLAEEVGTTLSSGTLHRIDMQVTGFGAGGGNVKLYLDNNLVIDFTGDLTTSGVSNLDNVTVWTIGSYINTYGSEFILADEDTRLFSLATLAPSAAGDTNAWTGAYTDVDEAVLSDADIVHTDTADLDFQCNLGDLPTGTFVIKSVKVVSRASKSASGITSLKTGIKSGGTVDVSTAVALDTAWSTVERIMAQNPVTANNWTTSEIDALQINLRSAT